MKNIFSTVWGIIITGIVIGVLATLLQKSGNPANMGICVACFQRDIAGALGFHRAAPVQYIRPEITGFVLGALISSLIAKEFRPRGGSSPVIRFFLGVFGMTGALVFLGCPWRAILRLAGGDFNALFGIAGLAAGIALGVFFLKGGYSLGRAYKMKSLNGFILPAIMTLILLVLLLKIKPVPEGALFLSEKGPGSMHASIILSLIAGTVTGILAQRSRFCTVGALRDVILAKDFHLLSGVGSLLITAFVMNLILGQFHPGWEGQPVAHTNSIWNFLGMLLSGLSFALAGGCPGRQLFLSGEGDTDAGIFVLGMIAGAAVAHNFAIAASPQGPGILSMAAVITGLVYCILVGTLMRDKMTV